MPVQTINPLGAEFFGHFVGERLSVFRDAAARAGRDFREIIRLPFRDLCGERFDALFPACHRDTERFAAGDDLRFPEILPAAKTAVLQLLKLFFRLFGQEIADERLRKAARHGGQHARARIFDKGNVRARAFQHPHVDACALQHDRRFAGGQDEHFFVRLHFRGRDDDDAGLFPVADGVIIFAQQRRQRQGRREAVHLFPKAGVSLPDLRRLRVRGDDQGQIVLFPARQIRLHRFRKGIIDRESAVRDDVRADHAKSSRDLAECVFAAGEPEIFADRRAHRRRKNHRHADVLLRFAEHFPRLLHRRQFARGFRRYFFGCPFRHFAFHPIFHDVPPCLSDLKRPNRGYYNYDIFIITYIAVFFNS